MQFLCLERMSVRAGWKNPGEIGESCKIWEKLCIFLLTYWGCGGKLSETENKTRG